MKENSNKKAYCTCYNRLKKYTDERVIESETQTKHFLDALLNRIECLEQQSLKKRTPFWFKWLPTLCIIPMIIFGCCGSEKDVAKPEEPYKVSVSVIAPKVSTVDLHRAHSYLEMYKKNHPSEIEALKKKLGGDDKAVHTEIIRKHLRSPSKHIEPLKPALELILDR